MIKNIQETSKVVISNKNQNVTGKIKVHDIAGSSNIVIGALLQMPKGLFTNKTSTVELSRNDLDEAVINPINDDFEYYEVVKKYSSRGEFVALSDKQSAIVLCSNGLEVYSDKKIKISNTEESLKAIIKKQGDMIKSFCELVQSGQIITPMGNGAFAPSTFSSILDMVDEINLDVDNLFYG